MKSIGLNLEERRRKWIRLGSVEWNKQWRIKTGKEKKKNKRLGILLCNQQKIVFKTNRKGTHKNTKCLNKFLIMVVKMCYLALLCWIIFRCTLLKGKRQVCFGCIYFSLSCGLLAKSIYEWILIKLFEHNIWISRTVTFRVNSIQNGNHIWSTLTQLSHF